MEAAGAQDLIVTVGLSSPQSQPNFVSAVAYRASGNAYFGDSGNGTSIGYSGANTAAVYSGATLTQAATDSTWHTIQTTTNGGSSEIIVDARPGGTGAAGTGTISGSMKLIGDYFGNLITGKVGEIGLWNGANVPGTTPIDNLNSQQHTYWGF
jgi:hypothetical protein